MEWLIPVFTVLVASWWVYVIHRRKRREAKELDKWLKTANIGVSSWAVELRRHPSAITERDVPRQRTN